MTLPGIKNIDVKGKRVLLRVDFNVLFEDGRLEDLYRIKKTMPTIEILRSKGAKIIILSHLSAGKGATLQPVAEYLNEKYFKDNSVKLISGNDFTAVQAEAEKMKDGQILMLDNLRARKEEGENDTRFAEEVSRLGDIFVNDAFSASHRRHASIVGIPEFLPSFAGMLFEEEVKGLQSVFNPEHPFLLILGGVKVETKIGVIDRFLNTADKIFIGGALVNNFFKAQGRKVGDSFYGKNFSVEKYLGNEKIVLPEDVKEENGVILDIGPKALERLFGLVKEAKFIVWNGPLGNIEEKGFDEGTKALAAAIAASGAKSVVGGGDTVAVLDELKILDKFSFVSTAGGAMLEFLANGTLPGIEALLKK